MVILPWMVVVVAMERVARLVLAVAMVTWVFVVVVLLTVVLVPQLMVQVVALVVALMVVQTDDADVGAVAFSLIMKL
jgi:hypothetical protein